MKHYRVQCSTVNCKTIHIYIVGFQVMETLLLEDDAKLEQARTRRARTICWATARMYRLSSGWAWQSWQLHACGFWIMANTVEEASCRCPVESQHWAKGPQTSNFWARIRFAPLSSLGSKRARMAEVTKSPALKLLGWSYTCMTLAAVNQVLSALALSWGTCCTVSWHSCNFIWITGCWLTLMSVDWSFPSTTCLGSRTIVFQKGVLGHCARTYIYIHTHILFYLHTLHVYTYIYTNINL